MCQQASQKGSIQKGEQRKNYHTEENRTHFKALEKAKYGHGTYGESHCSPMTKVHKSIADKSCVAAHIGSSVHVVANQVRWVKFVGIDEEMTQTAM